MVELPHELIAGILADPDSDAPRLVAADWYEDAGDGERAEFIRVQCEIAQFGKLRTNRTELTRLRTRELQLLLQYDAEWLNHLGSCVDRSRWKCQFHRGFIQYVWTSDTVPLSELLEVIPTVPIVEHISGTFAGTFPKDWLAQFGCLSNLRTIYLAVPPCVTTWEMLKPLTHLARLERPVIQQNQPNLSLISWELTEQFVVAQEQHLAEHLDPVRRLAAIRSRLGWCIKTTPSGLDSIYLHLDTSFESSRCRLLWTSGLDWISGLGTSPYLQHASGLSSLRHVTIIGSIDDDESISALSMLRSIRLAPFRSALHRQLASLTNLREISLESRDIVAHSELEDWPASQTNLECLYLQGVQARADDPEPLLERLAKCRSLKVLQLADNIHPIAPLESISFPELIELDCSMQASESLDWRRVFPKLRVVRMSHTVDSSIAQQLQSHGVYLFSDEAAPELAHSMFMTHSHEVTLAPDITLRIPDWLEPVDPAQSPHATSDIEPLGAWQEFGPGDEWPDLRILGPTRIWIERIAAPTGTQNAREWLTRPPTPFADVKWTSFIKIPSESPIPPRVLMWSHNMLSGLRAVWIGKHQIVRMVCEFSAARVTPWAMILQAMVAQVRVPKGM